MLAPAACRQPRRVLTLPSQPVASRQKEKERRRQERLERERAAALAAQRRRRLQYSLGGLLAVALVAGVVIVATAAVGGKDGAKGQPLHASSTVKIPAQRIGDMKAAAKAAGCTLGNPPYEGNAHETKDFKPSDYKTNPPTSGPHNPVWYQDGIYLPGDTPRLGMLVHPLEHGRIEVQYKPGTPKRTVDQLESLVAELDGGYHMLMFQNTTGMPYQVAATAWTHSLTCPQMNDRVFDAIRTFRAAYIDKGPEQVP
jgi:hypothetical protein